MILMADKTPDPAPAQPQQPQQPQIPYVNPSRPFRRTDEQQDIEKR